VLTEAYLLLVVELDHLSLSITFLADMPVTMFLNNSGGLNLTDSPLIIKDNQATGQSYNYDYAITGAITKVLGTSTLNSTPDAQLQTLGLAVHHNATTDARTLLRAAGAAIETVNISSGVCTAVADDTVSASVAFFTAGSTQPVVSASFNTNAGGTQTWLAGGGIAKLSAYTGTNVTSNGVPVVTGSFSASVNSHNSGSWAATGSYYYAITLRKRSTQTIGNAALDVSATVANTDDTVTLDFTSVVGIDTTKYDQIYIYRSSVSGVSAFTTGVLVTQIASTVTSYVDTGSSSTSVTNVPRPGNTILDNSVLTTGTYNTVATFKRRLVTSLNSTLYVSDLDKPESWPLTNVIPIPSGGPILALGTIGVPSEYTTGADQYLCIWKENELWVLTGDSTSNWELLFVDKTGCLGQGLVVPINGLMCWIGYTGVYAWNGQSKPSRISRPIQAMFATDGDIDKGNLYRGCGAWFQKNNQVMWRLSHRTKGLQSITLKLDTRLTTVQIYQQTANLQNTELDGVFSIDTDSNMYYGIASYRPPLSDESIYVADNLGHIYQLYNSASTAVSFDYETRPLDMGIPQNNKRMIRVLVYVEKLTANDLTMFYWADNRIRPEYQSKVSASLAPTKGTQPALFDIALFDQAFFDDYYADITPVQFNVHDQENNAVGTSFKLRFEQLQGSAPVRIHGFAVEWEDAGALPIPTQQLA
jgi:hypothetical protein